MREFRFRAWDKEKGKMFEPTFRAYAGELEELNISLNGRLGLRKIDGYYDQSMFPERFEIMQYTGLKDKYGVEIYEGDIVHLTSYEGVNYKALIVFKDGGFCAINGTESDYSFRRYDLSRFDLNLEVIGNIYENSDLV